MANVHKLSSKEKIVEISKQLEQGIKDVYKSDEYKQYLDTMTKFYRYSYNNVLLIALQRPDATFVAGYDAWKHTHQRQVKKGERGIKIISPTKYKVEIETPKMDTNGRYIIDGNGDSVKETKVVERTGFKISTVFDVSQTEGAKPFITFGPKELTGDVDGFEHLLGALKDTSPVPVEFADIPSADVKGYFSPPEGKIVIREGMSAEQTCKTCIHEIAHALCDADPKSRDTKELKETRAESIAYVCCKRLGINSEGYSFPYIAGWANGQDVSILKDNLKQIQEISSQILGSLEQTLTKTEELQDDIEQTDTPEEEITAVDTDGGIAAEELAAEPVHISRSR